MCAHAKSGHVAPYMILYKSLSKSLEDGFKRESRLKSTRKEGPAPYLPVHPSHFLQIEKTHSSEWQHQKQFC